MFNKIVPCIFACSLIATAAAQTAPLTAHTKHTGEIKVMPALNPAIKPIFSNLGPSSTNNYNDTSGYYVLAPNNSLALSEQWVGLPFTPKSNSHATVIEIAVGSISGTNLINVGLYSDNGGTVGTQLAQASSTTIPAFGTCCQLEVVRIPSTALSAGTQYWIVVSTDDVNGPDFTGVWQSSNNANTAANEAQGGWFTFSNNWPAGAVGGTIP